MTDPITKYVIQRHLFVWEDYGFSFDKDRAFDWFLELVEQYNTGCVNTRFRLVERRETVMFDHVTLLPQGDKRNAINITKSVG